MISGLLPDEIMGNVLLYTDPVCAYSLGFTSKFLNGFVKEFYKKNAGNLLRTGGEWHHCVKSKRTRDSLDQRISYGPMGVWSILHQRCVGCKQPFKAKIHKDFGVVAHSNCIRHHLLNTYYLEKLGLTRRHFEGIPHCELSGFAAGFYGRGTYSYTVIWKDTASGIVPYEWTAHYLVYDLYSKDVEEYQQEIERKRIATKKAKLERIELKKKQKRETNARIRALYSERMDSLIEILKPMMNVKKIKQVLRTDLPEHFHESFFKKVDIPHDSFTKYDYDRAIYVVSNISRLMEHMTPPDIYELPYNDLGNDILTLCRKEVACAVGFMIEKINKKHSRKHSYSSYYVK